MMKLSFIDKLSVLLDIINSSKEYILVFLALLFVCYILTSKKKYAKNTKKISLGIYLIIVGLMIYAYRNSLGNMFDYMMNNLFVVIYFPNLAIYLGAIITVNIVMWISIFNYKIPNFIKNINTIVYCAMTYLLIIILNIISENKLDVFNQSSVYSNLNAQALIELSSLIFIVWLLFLTIYKVIKSLIIKPQPKITKPLQVKTEKTLIKEEPKLYRQIPVPYVVKTNTNKVEVEKVDTKSYDDLLTLDDYKLLLSLLKKQKQKEQQEKERAAKLDKENAKFYELQQLYKTVR